MCPATRCSRPRSVFGRRAESASWPAWGTEPGPRSRRASESCVSDDCVRSTTASEVGPRHFTWVSGRPLVLPRLGLGRHLLRVRLLLARGRGQFLDDVPSPRALLLLRVRHRAGARRSRSRRARESCASDDCLRRLCLATACDDCVRRHVRLARGQFWGDVSSSRAFLARVGHQAGGGGATFVPAVASRVRELRAPPATTSVSRLLPRSAQAITWASGRRDIQHRSVSVLVESGAGELRHDRHGGI